MKQIETKTVHLGENAFWLRLTNTAMNEYEELTGESWPSFKSTKLRLQLFYCLAKEGARIEGKTFKYDYKGFCDVINDYYFEILQDVMPIIFDMMPEIKNDGKGKKA